jgi:hypothetical protein
MNHRILRFVLLACATSLGGCAATVVHNGGDASKSAVHVPAESNNNIVLNVSGSDTARSGKDWAAFRGEIINAVSAEASAIPVHFAQQDGAALAQGKPGTLVSIEVLDYHWVSNGARFGLGIMTGNAYLNAKVRYLDLATGAPFGEETIDTSSSAWQGIFAPMTDKQLQAVAKEIVDAVHPH